MTRSFPRTAEEVFDRGRQIQAELAGVKSTTPVTDYGWYPYDSISALGIVADLVGPALGEVGESLARHPAADIGCADGDLAMLLASFGAEVDAIDHRESNYNQMRGVETLQRSLGLSVRIHDVDLDQPFELPRADYGFALFLGTLYHLKNPFYVLEKLAAASDWCLISTRIAQVTPTMRTRIEDEPVAYLLGAREANNDPTNYWIFSPAGLRRVLERTGWMPVGEKRVGCAENSDPVHAGADERMFVLAKSRTRHPDLMVKPVYGWHGVEQDAWRWTEKRFGIQVALPLSDRATEFALRFTAPEALFEETREVRLECEIGGETAGTITCEKAETIEFRGRFPKDTPPGAVLRLDFGVESSYRGPSGDARDLGILVPLLGPEARHTDRLPFRVS